MTTQTGKTNPSGAQTSRAKRRNEFRHHMRSASVWIRNARQCRDQGMPMLSAGFIDKARADRAAAFGWLRG